MCGLAGALDFDQGAPGVALLERMARRMGYRGPDGIGVWRQDAIGLSHARLAIVDVAGGAQPMRTADGRYTISFNGEIFNHRALRADLERQGRRFATHHSDTEVVLQAYAHWGEDCFRRFNGQWALALWDAAAQRLLLSRDRCGICPLHYVRAGTSWVFASEAKALFCHPGVDRRLDVDSLCDILTFWAPQPGRTTFAGVRELEPGCCLTIDRRGARHWRYWQIDYQVEPGRDLDSWAAELRALLSDAVRLRLQADVPVGVYLSGGLDSSVVTGLAAELVAAEPTPERLALFSLQFDQGEFDERRFQQEVAERAATRHDSLHCAPTAIGESLPAVVRHTEKPLFRTAAAPLFLLSRRVRDLNHRVVLTGEGADEVLGGYDVFKEAKLRHLLAVRPDAQRHSALFHRLYPYLPHLRKQSTGFLQAYFQGAPEQLESPYFSHLPRWRNNKRAHLFLSEDARATQTGRDPLAELATTLPARFSEWGVFEKAQYLELSLLLPGYILSSQGDRVAMAHSVETRPVFLDHRVVELAARMPASVKLRVLNEKHVLKRAAGDLVPAAVLRRPKQPYRAPEAISLLAGDGRLAAPVAELLSPQRLRHHGVFNPIAVSRLTRKLQANRLTSFTENMALVAITSTQALIEEFGL